MEYQEINSKTIDSWVKDGWEWGKPIPHETYLKALEGEWGVYLTPTKTVPHSWFGELKGKKLLGLASGGAQQMPIFAALGTECTVLDYSDCQLESERVFAEREGYKINIIKADMTKPLPFCDESFDIIFHPVSNCYVRETLPIFKECYRILKSGGILLSGLDNGVNFFFEEGDETKIVNKLPYDPLSDPELFKKGIESNSGVQFSHTLEDQLGAQLKAGFILTELYEDTNGYGKLEELKIPTFWATKAIKAKIIY